MGNYLVKSETKQSEFDSNLESDEDYQSCDEEFVDRTLPLKQKFYKQLSNTPVNPEQDIKEDIISSDSENTPSDYLIDTISNSECSCNDDEPTHIQNNFHVTSNSSEDTSYHNLKGNLLTTSKNLKISGKGDCGSVTEEIDSAIDLSAQKKGCLKWEISFEKNEEKINKKSKPTPLKHLKIKKSLAQKRKEYKRSTTYLSPITTVHITDKKVLDLRRWYCMSRPQYKKSCGLTSLVSIWNYLYSSIGTGKLNPITQEDALNILGFKPPFGEIRFGPLTGNATLMRWFRRLNEFFCVNGTAKYMYKPKGRFQTKSIGDESALKLLSTGLRSENTASIYHCLNHYFCPIGYEETPQDPTEAYCSKLFIEGKRLQRNGENEDLNGNEEGKLETWVFIGEPSRKHPPIHCKKWTDILIDLHMEGPLYYDIRRQERGIQERKTKKKGGNLHCIIMFKKTDKAIQKI